jgi:hypothetical protein
MTSYCRRLAIVAIVANKSHSLVKSFSDIIMVTLSKWTTCNPPAFST